LITFDTVITDTLARAATSRNVARFIMGVFLEVIVRFKLLSVWSVDVLRNLGIRESFQQRVQKSVVESEKFRGKLSCGFLNLANTEKVQMNSPELQIMGKLNIASQLPNPMIDEKAC